MPPSADQITNAELARILIPAAIVVVGWVIVHWLSVKRELAAARRKSAAEQCDLLIEHANKLLEQATDYHTKERDVALERKIVAGFSFMGMVASTLKDLGVAMQNEFAITRAHTAFKRSVTAKHFSDEHDAPLAAADGELASMDVACSELCRCVIQARVATLKA